MRKFILPALLLSLLIFPSHTQAQSDVRIGQLTIQFWPEYDSPDMLTMYSFSLASETTLPAEIDIRIPANAKLNAVAKEDGDSMVNIPYDAPVKDGDWVTITMQIDDLATHRVEYYIPMDKSGSTRSYDFHWSSDYAIDSLSIQFQQPPSATEFTSTPMLPNANPVNGGITYHDLSIGELAAGNEFNLSLSYKKDNEDLTVSSMPIEVGGGDLPETNAPSSSFSAGDALPFVLVGVGILLIVGGLAYFFLSGRSSESEKTRKRHSPRQATAGANIYCHECGSRASGSDKFCRSCGVKLRL